MKHSTTSNVNTESMCHWYKCKNVALKFGRSK